MEMSDGLIERLDLLAKAFSAVRHSSRPTLTAHSLASEITDNIDTILSALKTVRGIDRLAKESGGVSIEYSPAWPDDENKVWHVGVELVGYTRETLSLAVDAAVGANEKGGK